MVGMCCLEVVPVGHNLSIKQGVPLVTRINVVIMRAYSRGWKQYPCAR